MEPTPGESVSTSTDTNLELLQLLEKVANDVSSLGTQFGFLRSEFQLFRGEIEVRLDRIESMTNQTRAEMLTLRADFREFRTQLKESMA